MTLTNEELLRYSRQLVLPDVGKEGQEKLKQSNVLIIGAGGLGSPNALTLSAAGVGTLGIIDFDVVDHTNLHRQLLYSSSDVGKTKVEAAKERILSVNPNTRVNAMNEKLTSRNALSIIKEYDVVIDGTDNFPTRYLVNDACLFLGKQNVYGSVFRFEGQATFFMPKKGPCYRCLYPEPPAPGEIPSCAEGGVLGILPGLIGMIQASETLKFLLGKGDLLIGRFLQVNVLNMSFREIKIQRDPNCPVCGDHPTIKQLIDYDRFCGISPQKETPGNDQDRVAEITPGELKVLLQKEGAAVHIIDVREPDEHAGNRIQGDTLIPLGDIVKRANELDPNQEYILYCRSGARSAKAIQRLQAVGFRKLKNLKGGMNAWERGA